MICLASLELAQILRNFGAVHRQLGFHLPQRTFEDRLAGSSISRLDPFELNDGHTLHELPEPLFQNAGRIAGLWCDERRLSTR
jgi:hypothetical protein